MANYTRNYNLKKPIAAEVYSVDDANGNMDIIDEALKEVDNTVDTKADKAFVSDTTYSVDISKVGSGNNILYITIDGITDYAQLTGKTIAVDTKTYQCTWETPQAIYLNVNGLGAKNIYKSLPCNYADYDTRRYETGLFTQYEMGRNNILLLTYNGSSFRLSNPPVPPKATKAITNDSTDDGSYVTPKKAADYAKGGLTNPIAIDNIDNATETGWYVSPVQEGDSLYNFINESYDNVLFRVVKITSVGMDPNITQFAYWGSHVYVRNIYNGQQNFNGISWQEYPVNINIPENAVSTTHIQNGAVTGAKIASDTITAQNIREGAVTTDKIEVGAVTDEVIAPNGITGASIAQGAILTNHLGNGAVTSYKLATDAVTSSKISDSAVETANIANKAVTTDKLADKAVTGAKIETKTITNWNLNDNAVQTYAIQNEAVTTAKLADEAVTGAKIASGAVTAEHISSAVQLPYIEALTDDSGSDVFTATISAGDTIRAVRNSDIESCTANPNAAYFCEVLSSSSAEASVVVQRNEPDYNIFVYLLGGTAAGDIDVIYRIIKINFTR